MLTDRVEPSVDERDYPDQEYPALNLPKSGITFQTIQNNTIKGIRESKKHCCLYCNKMYPTIARHLERQHSNEIKVGKI